VQVELVVQARPVLSRRNADDVMITPVSGAWRITTPAKRRFWYGADAKLDVPTRCTGRGRAAAGRGVWCAERSTGRRPRLGYPVVADAAERYDSSPILGLGDTEPG
jgi:hypothetical protein